MTAILVFFVKIMLNMLQEEDLNWTSPHGLLSYGPNC